MACVLGDGGGVADTSAFGPHFFVFSLGDKLLYMCKCMFTWRTKECTGSGRVCEMK